MKFNDRFTKMARIATRQALKDSGYTPENPEEFGVLIASGIGGLETIEKNHTSLLNKGPNKISPYFIPMSLINLAAGQVAIDTGAKEACRLLLQLVQPVPMPLAKPSTVFGTGMKRPY